MIREIEGAAAMKFLATKPTMIITTLHASGIVNAGVFGAWTNVSPNQIVVAVSRGSHTYGNMLREKEFALNIPGADLVEKLAILADDIPETESELDIANLSTHEGRAAKVPTIAECQAAVEFAFEREIEIGHHSLMLGRALGGWIRESAMHEDGGIDIFRARVVKDFKYPQALYVLPGEVVEG